MLFVEEEFRGNQEDYYDPRNSYLNEVLDRGLGIPITLSVVYRAVAEAIGLRNGRGRSAAAFHAASRRRRPNPSSSTRFTAVRCTIASGCEQKLSEIAEHAVTLPDTAIEPCSSRVLISRMLRNLKVIYGRSGDDRISFTHPAPFDSS